MTKAIKNSILIVLLLVAASTTATAQTNFLRTDFLQSTSSMQSASETNADTSAHYHSPKTATLLALIPGLGQAYNRKYWKIPIIYAGLGTATYFMLEHNKKYQSFRTDFINIQDTSFHGTIINDDYSTASQLKEQKNLYWKRRDQMILVMAGIYILNILDATVDAHLYTYDISDDLSMRIEPDIQTRSFWNPRDTYGVKLRFKF